LDQLGVPNDPQVCRQWINQNQSSLVAGGTGVTTGSGSTSPATGVSGSASSQIIETLVYDANRDSSTGHTNDRYSQCLEAVTICNEAGKEQECPICLENMAPTSDAGTTDVICIKICQHRFHKHCIVDMFDRGIDRCPNCRQDVGIEPRGKGPSGSMNIFFNPRRRCKGFELNSDGVIELHYKMQSGIQLAFMENPGQQYAGTSRIAYLPHNETGRKLLARLKYAFTHGLTFRVGTSLTSGRSNQITWTSIQHKTSLSSGPFGYPDPQYFTDCNDSLDVLRVPKAEDCA